MIPSRFPGSETPMAAQRILSAFNGFNVRSFLGAISAIGDALFVKLGMHLVNVGLSH